MISIFFLGLMILFLLHTLFKLINIKKNYIICFFITMLIALFVSNIESSIQAALEGCKLWFKAMVPTVFPFTVICNLLISYDGISLYSKLLGPLICKPLGLSKTSSFPIAASFLCGYPLGAKYCTDIYELGLIKKDEYSRLLNIATNAGPLFILGSVASSLLGNVELGYILLISNYISILIIGIMTRKKRSFSFNEERSLPTKFTINFGQALKDAVDNAINTTITIGGFIVLFSVIISIIKENTIVSIFFYNLESLLKLPKDSLYACFLGSIELTNGCSLISSSNLSIPFKLSIISFLCSFSGISIIAQVSSFIGKHNISIFKYTFFKFLQGIISFIITLLLTSILGNSILTSTIHQPTSINYFMYFIPLLGMLVLTLICRIINKLFFHIS